MDEPDLTQSCGFVVALEGPAELVATQLHLLPLSSQVLVLPALEDYVVDEHWNDDATTFSADSFIRKVHEALLVRNAAAKQFLREPSSAPRYVFLNGGRIAAWALCISTIRDKLAGGDLSRAESIFHAVRQRRSARDVGRDEGRIVGRHDKEGLQEPMARAMMAADALDRETASLQLDTELGDEAILRVFSPLPGGSDDNSSTTEIKGAISEISNPTEEAPPDPDLNEVEQTRQDEQEFVCDTASLSEPNTPRVIAVGQARIIQVRSSSSLLRQHQDGRTDRIPSQSGSAVDANGIRPCDSQLSLPISPRTQDRAATHSETETDFEPLLPKTEDIAICLSGVRGDELLESIIDRLGGSLSLANEHLNPEESSDDEPFPKGSYYASLRTTMLDDHSASSKLLSEPYLTYPWQPEFGIDSENRQTARLVPRASTDDSTTASRDYLHVSLPPTPALTPTSASGRRFYTLSMAKLRSPVAVQNAIRHILGANTRAASQSADSRTHFPVLPNPDDQYLWTPILLGSLELPVSILALGAENTVQSEYMSTVVRKIGNLSTADGGAFQTTQINLRYLTALATRSFAEQQLLKDGRQDDPRPLNEDPVVLASWLVPQLDLFLSANDHINFLLLRYSYDALPAVLALQKLVGTDKFKIGTVVQASNGPLSPSHSTPGSRLSTEAMRQEVDFLVTATTIEFTMADFLSGIHRNSTTGADDHHQHHQHHQQKAVQVDSRQQQEQPIMDADYIDEDDEQLYSPRRVPSPSASRLLHERAHTVPNLPDLRQLYQQQQRPVSPAPSTPSRQSFAPVVRTWRAVTWGAKSLGFEGRQRTPPEDGGVGSGRVEEDDEEMLRLRPAYIARRAQRGDSLKAMKWLGLA